jgi:hypothetical protein
VADGFYGGRHYITGRVEDLLNGKTRIMRIAVLTEGASEAPSRIKPRDGPQGLADDFT